MRERQKTAPGTTEMEAVLPVERRSHCYELTEYDAHQARLRSRPWSLKDVPFYRGPDAEHDPFDWHELDYLDVYEKMYGRRCGSAGIGRLREVGLVRVTDDDRYADHPYFEEDPGYLSRDGFLQKADVDVNRLADQQEGYAQLLEANGIRVYWIDYPAQPMGAYGPMTNQHSAAELTILPGGSIVPKKGYALAPLSGFGRTEYLARWAHWNLGIPVVLTVTGRAVWIQGMFLADDTYVHTLSVETNQAGLDQVQPVLKSLCGEDLQIHVIRPPGVQYFDHETGANAHTDMIIAPLDKDTVLVYGRALDVETHQWLRRSGYRMIEVEREEQVTACACNLVVLEPGHVVMHVAAKKAIAAVEAAGIQVEAVDYSEYNAFGGGIHCATMQILRDPGPRHFS